MLAAAAARAGVRRFVLGSSLRLFPADLTGRYSINETWRPRPGSDLDSLCAWLAEVCARETVRVTGTVTACLRLGHVVDDASVTGRPFDPYWLHVEDAVAAIRSALDADLPDWDWGVIHIGADGERAAVPDLCAARELLAFDPGRDFAGAPDGRPDGRSTTATSSAMETRPIQRVVIFGAGGPLAAAATQALAPHFELRLTDVRSIEDLLANAEPQSPGAPLPELPQPPHTWRVVDVRDPDQVVAACDGMDAIVNCTVVRNDVPGAFGVNMLGARNVMRGAVAHGIQRVVHTGPFMLGDRSRIGYTWDTDIVDDVPPRPGIGWLYLLSKLCGQEIVRIFATNHGLSVPALAFCMFRNPEVAAQGKLHPLSVSWRDAANAIRCALEVPQLPSPFEYFHIGADLPHAVYRNDKAKRLLGWHPCDAFEGEYSRRGTRADADSRG
jgi:nucleoside-diphosphate-sugar epimerase